MKRKAMGRNATFVATVKLVRPEGVYIEKQRGWAGSISPKCWGKGEERIREMANIHPGDRLAVKVVSRHYNNKSMSLVLASKAKRRIASALLPKCDKAKKAEFAPLPDGTYFLVDLSNMFGELEGKRCGEWIRAIESGLSDAGYGVRFFVEQRALAWAIHQQGSHQEAHDLKQLCGHKDLVTVIKGQDSEADLAILQAASVTPNSVCVSCDRYQDYKKMYPDIVQPSRLKTFSFSSINDKEVLSIMGVRNPIVLPLDDGGCFQSQIELERDYAAEDTPAVDSIATTNDEAIFKAPFTSISKDASIRLSKQLARKAPEGFFALADIYADGDDAERKLSVKYERLGHEMERRQREANIRNLRIRAQVKRIGSAVGFHLSTGGRKAFLWPASFRRGKASAFDMQKAVNE